MTGGGAGATGPTVAIDLGDTGVAALVGSGDPDRAPVELDLVPAAVFAPDDGSSLVTGDEARRRAASDPARYEPAPRRRVDEGSLLLGTRLVGAGEALATVLAATVDRAGPALRGERPELLVLTHPAGWGPVRRDVLRRAGTGLAARVALVPEPVAVAAHADWMRAHRDGRPGGRYAVLDVGAAGASAAVVDRGGAGVDAGGGAGVVVGRVLAARSVPEPSAPSGPARRGRGGDDADELLLAHVLAGLADDPGAGRAREVAAGATLPDRRHRQVLVEDVRAARERLSDAEQAEIPLPGGLPSAWCSRGELEDLLREPCGALVDLLAATLDDAGVEPGALAGVRLVGGFARTPLLATLVHRELGVPPVVPPEPRTVAARGALLAVDRVGTARPDGTGWTASGGGGVRAAVGPTPAVGPAPAAGPAPAGALVAGLLPDWPRRSGRPVPPTPGSTAPTAGPPTPPPRSAPAVPGPPPPRPSVPDDVPDDPTVRLARPLVPARRADGAGTPAGETPGGEPSGRWTPRRRAALVAAATVAVLVAGLVVAGIRGGAGAGDAAGGSGGTPAPTVVSAFSHSYELPTGWTTDGTDAANRRSRIRPVDAPRGPDLVAVQESPLGSPDPAAARAQLLAGFETARAAGGGVSDLQPQTTFGGRDVARYRQVAAPGTTVDWVVVLDGSLQLSVGCRHDDTGRDAVLAACARVVATLRAVP